MPDKLSGQSDISIAEHSIEHPTVTLPLETVLPIDDNISESAPSGLFYSDGSSTSSTAQSIRSGYTSSTVSVAEPPCKPYQDSRLSFTRLLLAHVGYGDVIVRKKYLPTFDDFVRAALALFLATTDAVCKVFSTLFVAYIFRVDDRFN